ncbi:MAG: hypothetical protein KF819_04545 [Labilithrix sp.]|nr:hypothetical protein [Labilithrix sp.]
MSYAHELDRTLETYDLTWDIVAHDDLPGGVVAWLRVGPASDMGSAIVTADLIVEGGSSHARVLNGEKQPLLLPRDFAVDGGAVERSVVVPALAVVDVPLRPRRAQRCVASRIAEARSLDIQAPASANGVAAVSSDGTVWIEVFPRRDDLCSILASRVDEPAAHRLDGAAASFRAGVAVEEVAAARLARATPVAATLGESFTIQSESIRGEVLLYGGRVAHLVARVLA